MCARERRRASYTHVTINTQTFFVDTYPGPLDIILSLPVKCVFKCWCLSHRQAVCYFPALTGTCAVRFLTSLTVWVELNCWTQTLLRGFLLFSCQLHKSISGRASRCLGSPMNKIQRGVVVQHQILLVHMFCCLFTSPMLGEKLMLVGTWCLSQQVMIDNVDPAAWRLLEIVMWYNNQDSWHYFT